MQTITPPVLNTPDSSNDRPVPRHWTRDEVYRAMESGIIRSDERLELIHGELFQKMTQNPPHVTAVLKTQKALGTLFASGYHVRTQAPLTLANDNEPEPDVMVVRGELEDYTDHPTPADVVLVVEVSDSTLGTDRRFKGSVYAEAGIAEYWVENLQNRTLEVYRDPAPLADAPFGFGYHTLTVYADTDTITPLAAPQSSIRVADLLPRPPAKTVGQ